VDSPTTATISPPSRGDRFQRITINTPSSGATFGGKLQRQEQHLTFEENERGFSFDQRYDMNDAFALENRVQEQRAVKAFEVTYLRVGG
jgi:hypothetical protein